MPSRSIQTFRGSLLLRTDQKQRTHVNVGMLESRPSIQPCTLHACGVHKITLTYSMMSRGSMFRSNVLLISAKFTLLLRPSPRPASADITGKDDRWFETEPPVRTRASAPPTLIHAYAGLVRPSNMTARHVVEVRLTQRWERPTLPHFDEYRILRQYEVASSQHHESTA